MKYGVLEAYKTVSLLYLVQPIKLPLVVLEAYKTVSLLYLESESNVGRFQS